MFVKTVKLKDKYVLLAVAAASANVNDVSAALTPRCRTVTQVKTFAAAASMMDVEDRSSPGPLRRPNVSLFKKCQCFFDQFHALLEVIAVRQAVGNERLIDVDVIIQIVQRAPLALRAVKH